MKPTFDSISMNKLAHKGLESRKQHEFDTIAAYIYNYAEGGDFHYAAYFEFPETKEKLLSLGFKISQIGSSSKYMISWED